MLLGRRIEMLGTTKGGRANERPALKEMSPETSKRLVLWA